MGDAAPRFGSGDHWRMLYAVYLHTGRREESMGVLLNSRGLARGRWLTGAALMVGAVAFGTAATAQSLGSLNVPGYTLLAPPNASDLASPGEPLRICAPLIGGLPGGFSYLHPPVSEVARATSNQPLPRSTGRCRRCEWCYGRCRQSWSCTECDRWRFDFRFSPASIAAPAEWWRAAAAAAYWSPPHHRLLRL